ncbi:MAG: hypothetical protein V1892_00620 [bacterium]
MLATQKGKKYALKKLKKRRAQAKKEGQIDDSTLPVGAPMHYYCESCGLIADVLPEAHIGSPKELCDECQALKDLGWLE